MDHPSSGACDARSPRAEPGSRWAIIQAPAGITLILLGALVFDDRRFILAMPVAINGILLLSFGRSLRAEQTMIERYARLVDPRLPPEEVVYCRQVTMVWCLFFAINGGIAASLALWAPLGWWALFTGLISYGLMGLLFGTEFIIRRLRFRRYGSAFYDVLLSRLFPARGDSP